MDKLDEENLKRIRETFFKFTDDTNEKIRKEAVEPVIRALNYCPSELNLSLLVDTMSEDENGCVSFEDFVSAISRTAIHFYKNVRSIEEVFAPLNKKGLGYLDASTVGAFLGSLGNKLTNDEIDELFKVAEVSDDNKFYVSLFARNVSKYLVSTKVDFDIVRPALLQYELNE